MIIASRHIIGYEKHETIIEIATSSTTVGKILESSVDEVQEIMEY
jgi:hypothetical protein